MSCRVICICLLPSPAWPCWFMLSFRAYTQSSRQPVFECLLAQHDWPKALGAKQLCSLALAFAP
jgi:hypothetical protein